LQKDNQAAQKAEEKVQQDLARLRAQLALQAASQPPEPQKIEEDLPQPSFESMLAKVKNDEKQRQYEQGRRGHQEKYDPEKTRAYKNW
jgi:hypothetical protein